MSEIIHIGATNNCYVIIGDRGSSVLVDTGSKQDRQTIYERIKEYRIRLILLTHGHIDHVENASFFSDIFNAPIAMSERDFPLIENPASSVFKARSPIGMIIKSASVKAAEKIEPLNIYPVYYATEGMNLFEYGIHGVIHEFPGHTKGSIGICVERKSLIIGDAMMNIFGSRKPKIYEERYEMLNSYNRIKRMGCSVIYFGHGKPLTTK